ncbi:hypothetical protein ACFL1E_05935 [Candidatus Omnitrophota bacterium]
MLYLFVGSDPVSKKRKIEQLKKECAGTSGDLTAFNYSAFFGKDLDAVTLQEEFQRLPTNASKRLIVLHEIKKLSLECKKLIVSFASKPNQATLLILDVEQFDHKDAFLKKIAQGTRIFTFKREMVFNAFNLAEAIERKNSREAFRIYAQLLLKGENISRILGGLVWHWKKVKRRMPQRVFQSGLKVFLDTDIRIKTGRMNPKLALEVLIVRLCSLGSG